MANWTNPKGLITNERAKIRSVDDGQLSRPDLRILSAIVLTGSFSLRVKFGSPGARRGPLHPQELTSPAGPVRSEKVP
jgi:hypothetical protein